MGSLRVKLIMVTQRGAKTSVDLNVSHVIGWSSFKFKHYLLNQVVYI